MRLLENEKRPIATSLGIRERYGLLFSDLLLKPRVDIEKIKAVPQDQVILFKTEFRLL